jgi:biopolymer transport protein ExbD
MRRRRRHTGDEVELNLAAMLDMAFQLLAFFILTFRPSPIEGQLSLRLPPPMAVSTAAPDPSAPADAPGAVSPDQSLMIHVSSDADGRVASVRMGAGAVVFNGPADANNLERLNLRLRDVFSLQESFEQVLIMVDPGLRFQELMSIIDVCLRQKTADGQMLTKLSFMEVPAEDGAP